jgi:putative DNA primase/helicase
MLASKTPRPLQQVQVAGPRKSETLDGVLADSRTSSALCSSPSSARPKRRPTLPTMRARAINAETIANALAGRKVGGGWTARCPAHDDRTPSLSLRDAVDGKVLVHCHAGCMQERLIAALRTRGLWANNGSRLPRRTMPARDCEPQLDHGGSERREAALAIWRSAVPTEGTLVETYLASRGLHFPPCPALRFHPGLKHPAGGIWPTMIALVTRASDDTPQAIHRTFLARDGSGKAPVDPAKMMLGPCHGGAVRLGMCGDVLMVGEGIETCLAAMQATGNPAWAALSTSGLRTLDLPYGVREVIVLADGDDPGEAAARDCAWRWKREGRRVRIACPPSEMDFNDLLVGRAPRFKEDAL